VGGVGGLIAAGVTAMPVLLVSYRVLRVLGPAEVSALRGVRVPFVARTARFLVPDR
jgi:hypothetical protein